MVMTNVYRYILKIKKKNFKKYYKCLQQLMEYVSKSAIFRSNLQRKISF